VEKEKKRRTENEERENEERETEREYTTDETESSHPFSASDLPPHLRDMSEHKSTLAAGKATCKHANRHTNMKEYHLVASREGGDESREGVGERERDNRGQPSCVSSPAFGVLRTCGVEARRGLLNQ
jgi:hypothetical protein